MNTPEQTTGIQTPVVNDLIARFVAACQSDERILAAFLGGSHASGTADIYSDVDLNLITADASHADFLASRDRFIHLLGVPLFLEDWGDGGDGGVWLFFILSGGIEGELGLAPASRFEHMHAGPYTVLLDKTGILQGAKFTWPAPAPAAQVETVRRTISWFWHDLAHHFIAPMARGQLWSAYGGLEDLRRACVNLARLSEDFQSEAGGYEKIERAVPPERLASLAASCCTLERGAMLQAAQVIVRYFQGVAPPVAKAHGLEYPHELAHLMSERLDRLGSAV